MDNIEAGDMVTHKTIPNLNGGVPFNVIKTARYRALCAYIARDKDQTMKEEWFEISDLIIVHKAPGRRDR